MKIERKILHMVMFILITTSLNANIKAGNNVNIDIDKTVDVAVRQSLKMCNYLNDSVGRLPRTIDLYGKVMTSDSRWWCSGFFPGALWYLYELSGNGDIKTQAEIYTNRIEREKYTKDNHDIGFMIFCSFGNAYRLTGNKHYYDVISTACESLSTRYKDNMKCIRSWDFGSWQYPVIIDNMMNLEMLLWGANNFNKNRYKEIAINHANTTMQHFFRKDNSCCHLVSFDTITGKPYVKQTHQGAFDQSAWARGQGWALYGYTFMYRETQDTRYLQMANKIAKFILDHPNLPNDKIPYWDFNAPNIPNEERDASAAALIASALLELSQYVDSKSKDKYIAVATKQIEVLSSDKYLAKVGSNGNFILKNSVGSKPHMYLPPYFGEVGVPLTYADYYFMEALVRYKKYVLMSNAK